MTKKLTILGHHKAFNYEQSLFCIVCSIRTQNDKWKTNQTRKLAAYNVDMYSRQSIAYSMYWLVFVLLKADETAFRH